MSKDSRIFDYSTFYPEDVKQSVAWFTKKVNQLKVWRLTPSNMMSVHANPYAKKRLLPGKMYFYVYDPKYKDTLPYYDTFPLVLPFARDKTHFTGLNLHYLDYKTRFVLLHELLRTEGIRELTEKTRLQYNWQTVKSVAKLAPAQACIKQYLISHVRSAFYEIPPTEWRTAVMLPVQQFKGLDEKSVWRESRRIYK